MEYMSVKEASAKWGISERRVRALCESGRIEGVAKCGDWVWSIPVTTQRPADGRTLRYIKNRNLRTGAQDYSAINSKIGKTEIILDNEKISGIILDAFTFSDHQISKDEIIEVLNHKNAGIDLDTQVQILNMKSSIVNPASDVSEKSLKEVNRRLMMSVDEKAAALYKLDGNQSEETEALFSQYSGAWSVIHPVARAIFLFAELIRIKPFLKANELTAFTVLAQEFCRIKLSPVVFGPERIDELKAALVSANMRGNTQMLIAMILEELEK